MHVTCFVPFEILACTCPINSGTGAGGKKPGKISNGTIRL